MLTIVLGAGCDVVHASQDGEVDAAAARPIKLLQLLGREQALPCRLQGCGEAGVWDQLQGRT